MWSDVEERPMNGSAERQLWCAVIERALQDAIGEVGGVSGEQGRQRAAEEARGWILRGSEDFRVACEGAGYDPDVLHKRLIALIERER
jgi:hypothetical protein